MSPPYTSRVKNPHATVDGVDKGKACTPWSEDPYWRQQIFFINFHTDAKLTYRVFGNEKFLLIA